MKRTGWFSAPLAWASLLALGCLLAGGTARAEVRRVAVLIGTNQGSEARPVLRYAENDAQKLSEVLVELGGIGAGDLFLVKGGRVARMRDVLARVGARVRAWRAIPRVQVVLLFYYSGHSDAEALEIGDERYSYTELRGWLKTVAADVRVTILDSCRSGGLVALKGASLAPAFDVHLAENMASTGDVLITSSAADEAALESADIGGSFFSHHLISGLRGAADVSGDGVVTLAEAYQYAFARTVSTTWRTIVGPQHPIYDYRLSGRGELALTRLRASSALLELPAGFERMMVLEEGSDRVLAELGATGARRLAVQPGVYSIRGWRGRKVFGATVQVAAKQSVSVRAEELTPTAVRTLAYRKGDGDQADNAADGVLGLAAGLQRAVAADTAFLAGLRASLATGGRRGFSLSLNLGTGRGPGISETRVEVLAGALLRLGGPRLAFAVGAEAGPGGAIQQLDREKNRWSGLVTAAAVGRVALGVAPSLAVTLEIAAPVTIARRDDVTAFMFSPAAWAGISLLR